MLKNLSHKTPEGMMQLFNTPYAFMELIINVIIPELEKDTDNGLSLDFLNRLCSGKAITHPGKIAHADDIFTGALLQILNPDITITRTTSIPTDYTGVVFDVGNSYLDHHATPREARPDGTFYAALGKTWRICGPLFFSDFVVKYIDENFCSKLDDTDNTGKENMLSQALGSFNPVWYSTSNGDAEYNKALVVAKTLFENYLLDAIAQEMAAIEVAKAVSASVNENVLILDKYVPWKYFLSKHPELNFKSVIYPSIRDGGFNAEIVPGSGFEFPQSWWGKITENNKPVNGITFCHSTGFLTAFDTLENAVNAVYSVL